MRFTKGRISGVALRHGFGEEEGVVRRFRSIVVRKAEQVDEVLVWTSLDFVVTSSPRGYGYAYSNQLLFKERQADRVAKDIGSLSIRYEKEIRLLIERSRGDRLREIFSIDAGKI